MMLNDERQKGKVTYKIWDIVVVVILAVLADSTKIDKNNLESLVIPHLFSI